MKISIKYIVIGIIVLGVLGVLAYAAISGNSPGTLIAGLAALFGGYKSGIFKKESLEEDLAEVSEMHADKRANWDLVAKEYESKYAALYARMDYIDFRTAKLSQQIGALDEVQKERIKKVNEASPEEMLEEFRRLMN